MTNVNLIPTMFSDIDDIMSWINDPRVTTYFSQMGKISREQEERYLEKILYSYNDKLFTILGTDGIYIGQCSINQIHWPSQNGRIFMVLKPEFHGQGLALKVLQALLDIAFNQLKLHKIWLIVRQDNKKGLHLYHRAGFRVEGVLQDEYKLGDQYLTMVRMAIIENTFRHWFK